MIRRCLPAVAVLLAVAATACASTDPAASADDGDPRWLVTVYYTPVESYHHGRSTAVTGCAHRDCSFGTAPLGRYPAGFVDAVREEGTGRITTGGHAGGYLNWSVNVGYWLDDAPRDAYGDVLRPFRTAAADGLAPGTVVRLLDCGEGEVRGDVCDRLRAAEWRIHDQFTPGLGGENHIDLYIGEQDSADFTTGPRFTTLYGATVEIG